MFSSIFFKPIEVKFLHKVVFLLILLRPWFLPVEWHF